VPWTASVADVAARKEERADDVGIGREGEAGAAGGEQGAVVLSAERGMGEGGPEDTVDQILRKPAAAAMADRDLGAVRVRGRARRKRRGRGRGGGHAAIMRRTGGVAYLRKAKGSAKIAARRCDGAENGPAENAAQSAGWGRGRFEGATACGGRGIRPRDRR